MLQIGGIPDHVHLVAAIRPTISVSAFMRAVKTGSCAAVREAFATDAFRWQRGYSAFTVAPHDLRDVLDYVAEQEQRHAAGEVRAAYERTREDE